MCLSHIDLFNYYKLIFNLKQHHGWNVEEIEGLTPYEREVYLILLKQWIDEENEKIKQRNAKNG